jgi:hypothetical protein
MDLDADDESIVCVGNLPPAHDHVDHPPYYRWHPAGIEAVDVCEAFSYNLGSALAYIWRCGGTVTKGDVETDLKKAIWYLRRELERLGNGHSGRSR